MDELRNTFLAFECGGKIFAPIFNTLKLIWGKKTFLKRWE
jgi:hypothetical protein